MNDLRKELGIDEYLELIKEDSNLNMSYTSLAQYMYILEQENQQLKEQLEYYKVQEAERINKDLLQAKNECLESCIKANMVGDKYE